MAATLYRVVKAVWGQTGREEKDIGCEWKEERAARAELKVIREKIGPGHLLSLQKKGKQHG